MVCARMSAVYRCRSEVFETLMLAGPRKTVGKGCGRKEENDLVVSVFQRRSISGFGTSTRLCVKVNSRKRGKTSSNRRRRALNEL